MSFGDLKVKDLIYEDSSNNEITVVIADLAPKNNPTLQELLSFQQLLLLMSVQKRLQQHL